MYIHIKSKNNWNIYPLSRLIRISECFNSVLSSCFFAVVQCLCPVLFLIIELRQFVTFIWFHTYIKFTEIIQRIPICTLPRFFNCLYLSFALSFFLFLSLLLTSYPHLRGIRKVGNIIIFYHQILQCTFPKNKDIHT